MRLNWDQEGFKLYETGVKHGVLYPHGTTGYDKGVAWNGLTGVTESPSGAEESPLYADDVKYLSMRSAEEFGGTIEAYTYPDEFKQCNGEAELANNVGETPVVATGVVAGQQKRKSFGLVYETTLGNDTELNDHGYKLHLVYNATASPSERAYQTINDSPEAITFSWEFTTTPTPFDNDHPGFKPTSCITIDSTKADPVKLKALEDILFGTVEEDPRLPSVNEVIDIFTATSMKKKPEIQNINKK